MDNIKLYEIDNAYVSYLLPFAPHLFKNKKPGQQNERKYIGVVLSINGMDYFAPLSSFKPKHVKMKEGLDFIKIKNYAVINLNNMFPVPRGVYHYVNIASIQDPQYKALLQAEYRFIKSVQNRIRKNGILSPVCETISMERDILVKNPSEFLLKHYVQREGMHVTICPIDFFVEIGKAADGEQHIDIFIKWPFFYSGDIDSVEFLFGHRFCNRIPYFNEYALPVVGLRVIKQATIQDRIVISRIIEHKHIMPV